MLRIAKSILLHINDSQAFHQTPLALKTHLISYPFHHLLAKQPQKMPDPNRLMVHNCKQHPYSCKQKN